MKFNAIFGESIIARRYFGSYVHNAKCPSFHHNDTTVFHINPEMATLQVFMGKEKQMLAPYVHVDEIIKKSSYNYNQ
ncbi:hypothetical protein PIROE2DRAFT_15371 [Piromyces sp. E2]|nr:hypothetical protein PIROE2DRAFT_15371 [Piromyces sp. E2]|eukprot:OUM59175.1 hypothetical protein PIROE2DRAFT_15371 [Piromyces sp. E2]